MRNKRLSQYLGDGEVCTIIGTCFTMCVLSRVSDLFRRQAELTCIDICALVFARLREVDFFKSNDIDGPGVKIAYPGTRGDEPEPLPPALAALEAEIAAVVAAASSETSTEKTRPSTTLVVPGSALNRETKTDLSDLPHRPESTSSLSQLSQSSFLAPIPLSPLGFTLEPVNPYSMAVVLELLSHLLRLLELSESRNTDRMRSVCLLILADFIQQQYQIIPLCESLWNFISLKLSPMLIQLLQGLDSPLIGPHLHQCAMALFGRYRRRLIAQTDLFLITIISQLVQKPQPGKPQSKVSKEYYLEMLSPFLVDPSFVTDAYVLYECGERFGYLLSDLINGLCTASLLDPKSSSTLDSSVYLLALDVMILFLKTLDTALGAESDDFPPEYDPVRLRQTRKMKSLQRQSADLFNKDPKDAFAFLEQNKLTSAPATPKEIAQYLRRTPGLDKKTIGEIVAKPSNVEILKEFLADFHLSGLEIDEALRLVLESFRLPGEAQQISRIMEALASAYFKAHPNGVFKNEDAVFVMAYSIVMLNTDQHNKQVRHRMTVENFIRNNRGINDGSDFDESFLRRIYTNIREKEIVLPEEQTGEAVFHYVWNEQLKKFPSDPVEPFLLDPYITDIAAILWRPILNCFKTCILTPRTDKSSKLSVRGLDELGKISNRFLGVEQLDELVGILVECLAFKEITSSPGGNHLARYLSRAEIFRLLVKCFFDIYRRHGGQVREGWRPFVNHLLLLVQSGVVSLATFDFPQSADRSTKSSSPTTVTPVKAESSLFSTLSQYLVSNPVDRVGNIDPETREKAMDFIRICKLEEIIRDSRFLPEESLNYLMEAMKEQLKLARPLVWEVDTLVFLVDLLVHTAWINRDRMASFWPGLFLCFSEVAKDLSAPLVVREHVILGLGRLSLRLADRPEMQKEVVQFFQLLCYVPAESFQHLAESALSIVLRIVELDPPILHGTAIWPHYFTVLALAGRSKSCGPYSFGLLTTIVREESLLFPLEFYTEYVDLLNGFIASTSVTTGTATKREEMTASGELAPSATELALRALHKFTLLESNVRRLFSEGHLTSQMLWPEFIIPVHCAIAQQCYHPSKEVRQSSLSILQKTLLALDYQSIGGIECLLEEFRLVLLPLLEELQRPELRKLEGGGIEEVQVRAASMVSRVLLSNSHLLFPTEETETPYPETSLRLWSTILEHLLHILSGPGDLIRESIPETIKNMLLVLASSGVLRPQRADLWSITWGKLQNIMPKVQTEIEDICLARIHGANHPIEGGSVIKDISEENHHPRPESDNIASGEHPLKPTNGDKVPHEQDMVINDTSIKDKIDSHGPMAVDEDVKITEKIDDDALRTSVSKIEHPEQGIEGGNRDQCDPSLSKDAEQKENGSPPLSVHEV